MTSDLYSGISKETHAMTFVPLCRHLSKEIDRTGKNEMLMFDLWQFGLDIELFGYFSHISSELKRSLHRANKLKHLLGGSSFLSVTCWLLFALYFIWPSPAVPVYRWTVILKVLTNRLSKITSYLFLSSHLLLKTKTNGNPRRRFQWGENSWVKRTIGLGMK